MRFSPETQPLRELAVEKILEQNMIIADSEKGLTIHEVEQLCDIFLDKRIAIFGRKTIEKALHRLVNKGRLIIIKRKRTDPNRYRLSNSVLEECQAIERTATLRNRKVVSALFGSEEDSLAYARPFFQCIEYIFSRLGEAYVRLLKGEISPGQIVSMPDVQRAVHLVFDKHSSIDRNRFEKAIMHFLIDQDPDFVSIKWNMSQNYFIAKSIGLNASDILLSKELFSDSTLYLDTNVIINAVEPIARHYRSLLAFFEACKKLNISIMACRISLQELDRVVTSRKDAIRKIADKIPSELQGKIADVFYRMYLDKVSKNEDVDLETIFQNFEDAKQILRDQFAIADVDDLWFDSHAELPATLNLANTIRMKSKSRRSAKSRKSSLHDALMLDWIRHERESASAKTWLVTLDTSLPEEAIVVRNNHAKSCVLTLDAMLQWISPIAISESTVDSVATVFSEAIRNQLLPQENLFSIADFLIFSGIEMDVKQLPIQDVEECLRYFRSNAPDLNPEDPIDREKIAHEMARFFVDPARKYQKEMGRLQEEIVDQKRSTEDKLAEMEAKLRAKDGRISQLETGMTNLINETQLAVIRRKARIRMVLSALPSIAFEAISVAISDKYGIGDNLWQKAVSFWPILTLGIVIFPIVSWFFVGKKGLKELGWPFSKLGD
jgi:predicted nucleic acid-binding protein